MDKTRDVLFDVLIKLLVLLLTWKDIKHIFLKKGFQSYQQDVKSQDESQGKIAELEQRIDIKVSNTEEDIAR